MAEQTDQLQLGKYPLLEWHLRNAICGGVEKEYEYLLDWFAHLVQFPDVKPGAALVIRGGRGWGKSIVFHSLARALGSRAEVAWSLEAILCSRFNGWLRGKTLLLAEEEFFELSPKLQAALKRLITEEMVMFEEKGIDPAPERNILRLVLISNSAIAGEAADNGRYFMPSVTNAALARDKHDGFFTELLAELQTGGMDSFLRDMALRKISVDCLRNLPIAARLEGVPKQSNS